MSQLKLSNYFKIEKMVTVTDNNTKATKLDIIETIKPIKISTAVQKSIVACGVSIMINGSDVSDQFIDVRKKGKYSSREIVPLAHRPTFCTELFNDNKVSDEYYTELISYERFIKTYGLQGQRVFEPFYGDGTSTREMASLVDVVGIKGANFWDIYKEHEDLLVLSNPPFSFKWQVIITLLEQQRNFALILPWETFYDKTNKAGVVLEECPLKKYQRKYGGKYEWFKCRAYERNFFHPTDDKAVHTEGRAGVYKAIGTHILYWRFDGNFTQDLEYVEKDERRTAGRFQMRKLFKAWKTFKAGRFQMRKVFKAWKTFKNE